MKNCGSVLHFYQIVDETFASFQHSTLSCTLLCLETTDIHITVKCNKITHRPIGKAVKMITALVKKNKINYIFI